jgi:hypothetical protein
MKSLITSATLFYLCFVFVSPGLADANTSSTADTKSSSPKPSIPKRVLGAIVGTVVGTPVCIARRILWDEKDGIRGIVGDTSNKVAIVSAGAFWLPFSITTGCVEAPCYSFKHSMCNTDKPFSKEQFSLGNEVE